MNLTTKDHRLAKRDDFDYKRYLASREWAVRREAVRARCGGWCERCHLLPLAATHHLTYEHIGNEPLEDLLGVCVPCHEWLSAKSEFDPLAWWQRFRADIGDPEAAGAIIAALQELATNIGRSEAMRVVEVVEASLWQQYPQAPADFTDPRIVLAVSSLTLGSRPASALSRHRKGARGRRPGRTR